MAGAFAFRTDVTVCKYIRLESADVDSGNVLPPLVSINGGELQGLPAILEAQSGDTVTVSASLFNDVNKDGVIDLRDVTRAQRAYGSNDAAADVNHDGSVNVDDLFVF